MGNNESTWSGLIVSLSSKWDATYQMEGVTIIRVGIYVHT